ncbi:MAG: bifunctional phosphoribosyl-AMP cyclohydrolase/phosphoribosyl-ATP diphosphatase HisIE [Melioribacteraceae bacterium]|nr:bifunctional phosphoribosyl-AMP cyclohydrolase/phosphoribosyl-ATP diphosphatase HisIE [Melioribacteraceae bacterium]
MKFPNIDDLNFEKLNGLLPAIVSDSESGQVLMLGFMNQNAYEQTTNSGKVTFFSRTKNRLWTKGETSGNFLNVVNIKSDCDNDTILISAQPLGNTCHLDQFSCFGEEKKRTADFLIHLNDLVKDRKKTLPEGSYTTELFKSGENRIIQKVGEEAIETVIAAKNYRNELIEESSDLVFHLLVLLAEKEIDLMDIVENLKKRHK